MWFISTQNILFITSFNNRSDDSGLSVRVNSLNPSFELKKKKSYSKTLVELMYFFVLCKQSISKRFHNINNHPEQITSITTTTTTTGHGNKTLLQRKTR